MTMPDEHGDVHAPPPSTAPVIVEPIQPHQSRTIRLGWLTTMWTVVIGALPDLLEFFFYFVMNDKAFSDAIANWFPRTLRYPAMSFIVWYAQKSIRLRKVTVAPIAGTPAATYALPLISPSHTAPVRTKEDQP